MKPHTAPTKNLTDNYLMQTILRQESLQKNYYHQIKEILGLDEEPVLEDNPKAYGIDLLCEKHNLSVEVETKHGWGSGKFQWVICISQEESLGTQKLTVMSFCSV